MQASDFRHADLRRCWASLTVTAESEIGQGAITYQLRQLRLHSLIERLPKTHRYRMTATVYAQRCSAPRSYIRFSRPGLAFGLPGHPAIETSPKRAVDIFENEVQAWVDESELVS